MPVRTATGLGGGGWFARPGVSRVPAARQRDPYGQGPTQPCQHSEGPGRPSPAAGTFAGFVTCYDTGPPGRPPRRWPALATEGSPSPRSPRSLASSACRSDSSAR